MYTYQKFVDRAKNFPKFGRPLMFCEKIIAAHDGNLNEGFVNVKPDRVALQDASAQMALLQLMTVKGMNAVHVPTSVHCDHLIVGEKGEEQDLEKGIQDNREVFDFLQSASKRYGIDFWAAGSGIIHQIVLENYGVHFRLYVLHSNLFLCQ